MVVLCPLELARKWIVAMDLWDIMIIHIFGQNVQLGSFEMLISFMIGPSVCTMVKSFMTKILIRY